MRSTLDADSRTGRTPDVPLDAVGYAGVLRELLPIALWREDAEGRIVEWSLAAQDLLGHRSADVLGRPASELLVPEGNRELADQLTRRVHAGRRWWAPSRCATAAGTRSRWRCGSSRPPTRRDAPERC
ncbi:PAS domain-containing protein [Streptomyces zhihengii]